MAMCVITSNAFSSFNVIKSAFLFPQMMVFVEVDEDVVIRYNLQ